MRPESRAHMDHACLILLLHLHFFGKQAQPQRIASCCLRLREKRKELHVSVGFLLSFALLTYAHLGLPAAVLPLPSISIISQPTQLPASISTMNIEALCAAPPEALAHSPSQIPLSCPVAPPSQRELHQGRPQQPWPRSHCDLKAHSPPHSQYLPPPPAVGSRAFAPSNPRVL